MGGTVIYLTGKIEGRNEFSLDALLFLLVLLLSLIFLFRNNLTAPSCNKLTGESGKDGGLSRVKMIRRTDPCNSVGGRLINANRSKDALCNQLY